MTNLLTDAVFESYSPQLSVIATYYAGDFNRDGHVNAADILPMMQALTNLPRYRIVKGLTDPTLFKLVADVNGDGLVNNADLQMHLNNLKAGYGSADPVPEPASVCLMTLGATLFLGKRKPRRRDTAAHENLLHDPRHLRQHAWS